MTKPPNGHKVFVFGDFRLEGESQMLLHDGKEIHLGKTTFLPFVLSD